ncbi:MAG: response regulator transcription factor [Gammaproteobacteria bacterium]|uniref:Response regulator transcription factor n=1 Tax=Candidatus Thiopontia autotrophica TaxID=2841688 RepID=A0A8J6P9W0_9GAMM|nr:response regulator transcription factor [Candidatus Thiopontia autotrophica]
MDKKILIVEDDCGLAGAVRTLLEENNFAVILTEYGSEVEDILSRENPALIILDVMLPDGSGLDVASHIRGSGNTIPILFVSALTRTDDVVAGLQSGGDDYLRKPFDPRELLEKIKAMIRSRESLLVKQNREEKVVVFGKNKFNRESHILVRDGEEVDLSPADTVLLQIFLDKVGRVLSRDYLVTQIHAYEQDVMDRSIDARINRLRKKIEDDPSSPDFLITIRGFGYRFSLDKVTK